MPQEMKEELIGRRKKKRKQTEKKASLFPAEWEKEEKN